MRFPLALIFTYLSCFVNADTIADAARLRDVAFDLATSIFASLNGTALLDTSGLVTNMTHTIQGADTTTPPQRTANSSSTAKVTLDSAYLDYADQLASLSDAVFRRGRLFHSELNLPVYQALQGLSSAVHTYGYTLTSQHLISRNGTIRTMTAGSNIIRAQAAWSENQNFPGRRTPRWRD